ncbi:hypothetical protein ACFYKX_26560 [Cytobacillus sp. FJAT-54145]|uniref:Uncharacterized protein n=1 Tax=Cytobacillus spartinae TaxID=3299023 RepID=A0ABW6KIV9_9BACI
MAVTAKQVFDMALVLIDEVTETGAISVDNPLEYQTKALNILNTLQFELVPPDESPVLLTSISQDLSVSDRTAVLILPYGLAAHLLLNEGDSASSIASFYNSRYEELKRRMPTQTESIEDIYEVLGGLH